jgi:hypothetical protein
VSRWSERANRQEKVIVYVDGRWKSACKEECRWMVVTDGKVDLDSEASPIRLKMLLPMPMKGSCYRWNRKYADGKEVDENSIVIETDKEIDMSGVPFLCLLESDSYKSYMFP